MFKINSIRRLGQVGSACLKFGLSEHPFERTYLFDSEHLPLDMHSLLPPPPPTLIHGRGVAYKGGGNWKTPRGLPTGEVCLKGVGQTLCLCRPPHPPNQKSGRYTSYWYAFFAKMHPVVGKVVDCSGGRRTAVRWGGGGVKDIKSSKLEYCVF